MQLNLPMTVIANYCFNVASLIAIDLTFYTPDKNHKDAAGQSLFEKRMITLTLMGPTTHAFTGAGADEFFEWYLELTGQNKIERVRMPGAARTSGRIV